MFRVKIATVLVKIAACICLPLSSLAFSSSTIELNSFGLYISFAHANMVDVLPVPGGP